MLLADSSKHEGKILDEVTFLWFPTWVGGRLYWGKLPGVLVKKAQWLDDKWGSYWLFDDGELVRHVYLTPEVKSLVFSVAFVVFVGLLSSTSLVSHFC